METHPWMSARCRSLGTRSASVGLPRSIVVAGRGGNPNEGGVSMSEWIAASQALRVANESLLGDTRVRIAMSRRILGGWLGIRGGSSMSSGDPEHPHWPVDELERLVRDKFK